MSKSFKKLALAVGVTAGLAAASMPTQAIMQGIAGEALLVPLTVWGGSGVLADPFVNTLMRVTVPGAMGFDTIPNEFTASHTTPTNANWALTPNDPSLTPSNAIHWYFFSKRSVHLINGGAKVTADDVVELNWQDLAQGRFKDVPGYMVIGTTAARSHGPADFSMFGEAWVVAQDPTTPRVISAPIPVLAMNDGDDGPIGTPVSVDDQVKYGTSGNPVDVSPLISGMRTNRSDGLNDDFVVFDLALSNRTFPTIHVVWLDQNLNSLVDVDVFDTNEQSLSDVIPLPDELNVVYVEPRPPVAGLIPPLWATQNVNLQVPTVVPTDSGFVRYVINEYVDNNIDAPESSGVAFALVFGAAGAGTPNRLDGVVTLGQERGTFKFR
jgi:hypothetical protein